MPTRRSSTSCRRTSSRAPPSTSPRWSSSPRRSRTAGYAYATDAGNVYYAVGVVPGLRAALRQYARRAAGRPSWRGRAGQARPGRFRAVEGRRARAASLKWPTTAGATASRAGTSNARRWRGATSGDQFDLHTGGIDNVFPHHEDEIAQSAPLVGGPPARVWVHGEHLLMAGRKMAKSAGNFQRVTELVDDGHRPARVPLPRRSPRATAASSTTPTRRSAARRRRSRPCARAWPRSARRPPTARGRRRRSSRPARQATDPRARPAASPGSAATMATRRRTARTGQPDRRSPRWTRAARPLRGGARR